MADKKITLYQTLADRDNPEEVEYGGPFICKSKSAWLGFGYYFWDTHKTLAHWWGEHAHQGNYIICKSSGVLDETCWDLHGDGNHRIELYKAAERMVKEGLAEKDTLLVPQVIQFLKSSKNFDYKAIRALGTKSMGNWYFDKYAYHIKFMKDKAPYLDMYPPVQLCLLSRKALSLQSFQIVFPDHYIASDFA